MDRFALRIQRGVLRCCLAGWAWLSLGCGFAAEPAGSAPALEAQYVALRPALEHNAFGRPLHLESREDRDRLDGDVHAVLDYPFPQVERALGTGQRWCAILLLHLNVKGCGDSRDADLLRVYLGRKFDEPLSAAQQIDFAYRVRAAAPDYFQVALSAQQGPFGTRDYRIVAEAVPLGERTFLHLSFAYAYGAPAKAALRAYLATLGARKVGFTAEGRRADGTPVLVGGLRGALERNVMRYYLAIEAYLAAQSAAPEERLEDRLREWFQATERYAPQLHELDEAAYLQMKRRECAPSGESSSGRLTAAGAGAG